MHGPVDATGASSYRFGGFTTDLGTRDLRHGDQPLHLTKRAFDVLAVLVQREGQTVEKEDLFKEVWGEIVVEENNLARHISVIRKALHQFEPDQEYVVTVPGRGYRFHGVLTRDTPADPPVKHGNLAGIRILLTAAALVLLAAASMGLWRFSRPSASGQTVDRDLRQLTSAGSVDGDPAWSPDGRMLAFTSDRAGNLDIWVQQIGDSMPRQVTFGPAADSQPTWSPDGRRLAFRSEQEGGGIFVVPASGGAESRLTDFGQAPEWSPDGKHLLFTGSSHGQTHVYVIPATGGGPVEIRRDFLANLRQVRAAWHPDGQISIYGRRDATDWEFWTISLAGDDARRSEVGPEVARQFRDKALRPLRFSWSPDGGRLYFAARAGESEDIWRVGVDRSSLRWTSGPDRLTMDGGRAPGLALSPDGTRLAFTRRQGQTRVWALPFDPVGGRLTGRGEPLTPFGLAASVVDMSPDGERLAYRAVRSGREELWVRSVSTASSRLAATEDRAQILQPRWSTDGRQLAYLRLASTAASDSGVVLVDSRGDSRTDSRADSRSAARNRVLPQSRGTTQVYDWAPDGQSLVVGCENETGRIALCTMPVRADGGVSPPTRTIATDPSRDLYSARISPDSRWVTFMTSAPNEGTRIYVIPANGGNWTPITDGEPVNKPRWSPDGATVYYVALTGGAWNLWGRRVDPVQGTPTGQPFQVTRFNTPGFALEVGGPTQLSITRDHFVVPITESVGAVWILDHIDR